MASGHRRRLSPKSSATLSAPVSAGDPVCNFGRSSPSSRSSSTKRASNSSRFRTACCMAPGRQLASAWFARRRNSDASTLLMLNDSTHLCVHGFRPWRGALALLLVVKTAFVQRSFGLVASTTSVRFMRLYRELLPWPPTSPATFGPSESCFSASRSDPNLYTLSCSATHHI